MRIGCVFLGITFSFLRRAVSLLSASDRSLEALLSEAAAQEEPIAECADDGDEADETDDTSGAGVRQYFRKSYWSGRCRDRRRIAGIIFVRLARIDFRCVDAGGVDQLALGVLGHLGGEFEGFALAGFQRGDSVIPGIAGDDADSGTDELNVGASSWRISNSDIA